MLKIRSLGVTGSRQGLTAFQSRWTIKFISQEVSSIRVLHHGDCIGADEEFATSCRSIDKTYIIAHPGDTPHFRARCRANDLVLPNLGNLERNRVIVKLSDFIVGFPSSHYPTPRSGTWYTLNYAKEKRVPRIIVGPQEVVLDERAN